MVRFPKAPDTFVTLHINCVSCNELFMVAEDEANAKKLEFWRTPSKKSGKTEFHERPEQTHKLVRPLTRSTPEFEENAWQEWQENVKTAVNCPRCGTDNRNWLRLAYAPHPGNKLERLLDILNRFWLTWLSVIVTGFLLLRLFFHNREDQGLIEYVLNSDYWFIYALMLVIIILGTIIPITAIPNQWRKVRIHKIERVYDKTQSFFDKISPISVQGVAYFGIFVLLIPLVVYILLPRATSTLQKETPLIEQIDQALVALNPEKIQDLYDNHPNELAPTEGALASLQGLMPNNLFLCDPATIDTMRTTLTDASTQNLAAETAVLVDNAIYHLEQLKNQVHKGSCDPQIVANVMEPLGTLYAAAWQKCAAAPADEAATDPICNTPAIVSITEYLQRVGDPGATPLGTLPGRIKYTLQEARTLAQQTNNPQTLAQIESNLTTIENAIKRANDTPDALSRNTNILNTWLKYVGLSCLVAVITAVAATNIYESKVRRHLPQPLCHSLSRLTRVVLWEARHTLEINGQFDRIEWNKAHRNTNGGITLRGHLCPPTNGQPPEKYIRAMSYTLISDLWGHITVAEARPIRVTPSIIQAWDEHEKETKDTLNKLFIHT